MFIKHPILTWVSTRFQHNYVFYYLFNFITHPTVNNYKIEENLTKIIKIVRNFEILKNLIYSEIIPIYYQLIITWP